MTTVRHATIIAPGRFFRPGMIALFLFLFAGCAGDRRILEPGPLVEEAREQLLLFQFQQARNLLNRHAEHVPAEHPLRGEYLFLRAMANWHTVPPVPADVVRAGELFEELVNDHPDHSLVPQALLFLGRLHDIRNYAGDEPDYERARAYYQKFLERFPDHDLAGDAVIRIGMTHIKAVDDPAEIEKGIRFIRDWHEERPDSRHAPVIALFLGTLYDQFSPNRADALRFYQQASSLGLVNPGRAGVNTWRLAELAVEVGFEANGHEIPAENFMERDYSLADAEHLRIAIEACQTVIRDYPRSGRGFEAVLKLRRIRETRPDLEFEIPVLQLFDLEVEEADA